MLQTVQNKTKGHDAARRGPRGALRDAEAAGGGREVLRRDEEELLGEGGAVVLARNNPTSFSPYKRFRCLMNFDPQDHFLNSFPSLKSAVYVENALSKSYLC